MNKFVAHQTDWTQIERFLASADRKLVTSHKIVAIDEEASLQQAYESTMKASIGFMFSHGFRARSLPGHHIVIIEFVEMHLGKKHAGLIAVFDHLRRKRNAVLYDDTGFVSRQDAEVALSTARGLLRIIREDISQRRRGAGTEE